LKLHAHLCVPRNGSGQVADRSYTLSRRTAVFDRNGCWSECRLGVREMSSIFDKLNLIDCMTPRTKLFKHFPKVTYYYIYLNQNVGNLNTLKFIILFVPCPLHLTDQPPNMPPPQDCLASELGHHWDGICLRSDQLLALTAAQIRLLRLFAD
jgi:hypothetical protein